MVLLCKPGEKRKRQPKSRLSNISSKVSQQPIFIKFGVAALLLLASVQAIRKLVSKGSKGSLENRGLMPERAQNTQTNDPYFTNMMRNVNTVQYEELSPEQIAAARQRRSQDRRYDEKIDLDKIELPANHPFAVSKQISDEEEQLQKARLRVRRGMPLKDLSELKSRQAREEQLQDSQTRRQSANSSQRQSRDAERLS